MENYEVVSLCSKHSFFFHGQVLVLFAKWLRGVDLS